MLSARCFLYLLVLTGALCVINSAGAQEPPLRTIGVSGDMDSSGRSPVLSVGVNPGAESVQIVADAYVDNSKYTKYPIQFDFYVNRKLFSSQIRSTELPGPVGIDVGRDVAALPFNYTVVSRVITPNGRYYSTVLQGAVFATNLVANLDCTVISGGINDGSEFIANQAQTSQSSNDSFALSFKAEDISEENDSIQVNLSLLVGEDSKLQGVASTNPVSNSSALMSRNVSGEAEFNEDGSLESFNVESVDGQITLRCS